MICPVCNSKDNCKFVFVEHVNTKGHHSKDNPSDFHYLYLCDNLHVFDQDGKSVVSPYSKKETC